VIVTDTTGENVELLVGRLREQIRVVAVDYNEGDELATPQVAVTHLLT
jgi:hypothetical protein